MTLPIAVGEAASPLLTRIATSTRRFACGLRACIVGHGLQFAESERVDHAVERDVVILGKIPSHGFGAALAERAISRPPPSADVTGHLNEVALFMFLACAAISSRAALASAESTALLTLKFTAMFWRAS